MRKEPNKIIAKKEKFGFNFYKAIIPLLALTMIFALSWILTGSLILTTALSMIAIFLPIEYKRADKRRKIKIERDSWPIAIDHLISAINSGISLTKAISDLALRGPEVFHNRFRKISSKLNNGEVFQEVLRGSKKEFLTSSADQVFEVLVIARVTGSSDIGVILRTLGDFLRQDNSMRAEIDARHGWVKSSATLAAFAPWLLLAILSFQPTTRSAFSSGMGVWILFFAVVLTFLAYLWMSLVSRLPEVPRVLT
jgi:tight adherence protein B